ncbi:hypothetical protein [Streptomyces broussonetiae]|uniref:hypothetical protein n=1 Tax=Streptomyces broussonetiae TaxID=2686304 RepID=UPI0035D9896C
MTQEEGCATPAHQPLTRIPALPGLGTSWYKRGARYWLRRVFTGLLWLAVLAFVGCIVVRLRQSFRVDLPSTLRLVWDCAQVALACVALAWGWVTARRRHQKALLIPPTPTETRAARRARAGRNVGLALAGRILWLVVMPTMPAVFAYAIGEFLAVLTVRESAAEVGARRWLEKYSFGT